jgi:hypothetical protein
MKPRHVAVSLIMLSGALLACTFAGSAPASPNAAPTPPGTSTEATLPPLAPGTLNPTRRLPTATLGIAATPSATPTITATTTLTPTNTPPPPVSTGPLDFTVSISGCRLDPTRGGGVILTLRFDATGGNGVYTYYRENQRVTRTFDRPATKGTAVIDSFRVESGDGQRVDKKERFTGAQFGCP